MGKVGGYSQLPPFTLTPQDVKTILIGHGVPLGNRYRKRETERESRRSLFFIETSVYIGVAR